MDPVTHALSGALVARLVTRTDAPTSETLRRMAVGALAAAAPDLDVLLGVFGPEVALRTHRGVTHSVLMLPLWAWLVSLALAPLVRAGGGWRSLYGLCALGLGLHIAGDLITSFGTMVFAPLSDWRAALGTTFIIDLWLTGLIAAGLVASAAWRRSRWPAAIASVLVVAYIGLQAVEKQRAIAFGEAYAHAHAIPLARVTAQPRPVSPFNWTVFVSDGQAHRYAHVNLRRDEVKTVAADAGPIARLDAPYRPLGQAEWLERSRYGDGAIEALAREAWQSPALAAYRWFADLPAFDGTGDGSACVWFTDLRFLTPGRGDMPFRIGACRDAPGLPWVGYQRVGETGRVSMR
jgi:inner membrane protein